MDGLSERCASIVHVRNVDLYLVVNVQHAKVKHVVCLGRKLKHDFSSVYIIIRNERKVIAFLHNKSKSLLLAILSWLSWLTSFANTRTRWRASFIWCAEIWITSFFSARIARIEQAREVTNAA